MSKTNYPAQIPIALGALNGHLIAVDYLYHQLKSRFVNRENQSNLQGVVSTPGDLSPLITNIAFSIELALKVLRIQDSPEHAPRGHDLFNLWKPLSSDIKSLAESKYVEILSGWDEDDPLKYVAFGKGKVDEPIAAQNISKALKNIKDAFVEWRYMYENMGTQKTLIFNFVEANCAIKALRYASSEFKGGMVVKSEWGSEK